MLHPRERLIVALDVSSAAAAHKIVAAVGESASIYKVGMRLYTAEGPAVVRELIQAGHRVFLDLKYHDIPNTVASAVTEAAKLGVSMLTIHAAGGAKMIRAAADAAKAGNSSLIVLAVTVLTSMDDNDLRQTGVKDSPLDQVTRLASLAVENGCQGIVSSALEARELRRKLGANFELITPGVRPAGSSHGDQARVVTPADAIRAGATRIVVGRPVTGSDSPSASAQAILDEIAEATLAQPA